MSKKKKQKQQKALKITIADYLKAVKKADREISLEQSAGWVAMHKVHKSKKIYDRNNYKDVPREE